MITYLAFSGLVTIFSTGSHVEGGIGSIWPLTCSKSPQHLRHPRPCHPVTPSLRSPSSPPFPPTRRTIDSVTSNNHATLDAQATGLVSLKIESVCRTEGCKPRFDSMLRLVKGQPSLDDKRSTGQEPRRNQLPLAAFIDREACGRNRYHNGFALDH